ncbi:FUSC family protein [Jiulongibacter sp. NS-SX5]|uniref:FUSC family protein n=1 Tax=Jiulongibacter sp. NS-SX5 TaxID=3463854 RepID=UPI004058316E
MKSKIEPYLLSFDTIKGLVLTISLVIPVTIGFQIDEFYKGFAFALGTLFTFLPNTDGSNRHRFWGILSALAVALLIVGTGGLLRQISYSVFVIFFAFACFFVSMLSVYGIRGAMVGFSGQLAIVMSFALQKSMIPLFEQLALIAGGGLWYLVLAGISHKVFEKKNIALNLAQCIEDTSEYLKTNYQLLWNEPDNALALEKKLLNIQVKINGQHELLRELLYQKRISSGQSNRTNRYLLIFLEVLDIYELSQAQGVEKDLCKEIFSQNGEIMNPLKDLSAKSIVHLYALAEALRKGDDLLLSQEDDTHEEAIEKSIGEYVQKVGLPEAREGVLLLRNIIDSESKKWEKISQAKRIYNRLLENTAVTIGKKDRKLFITSQDYSWNTIKNNLSFESNTFKHALRFTSAMMIGLVIGSLMNHQNSYWILLTIGVSLRPNFGLTKERVVNRIIGTLIGAAIGFIIVYITDSPLVYGILAVPVTFIGFSFLQKNYKVAATFITLIVVLLYALLVQETYQIIGYRVLDTLIGAAISFAAIYVLWPSWEGNNIKGSMVKSLKAVQEYFGQVDRIYQSKEIADTGYRLSRKKAFIETGNLLSSFQRLTEEPKSQQIHTAQVQAMVVLVQTFLNATAAMGTYIQNHITTEASEAYRTMVRHIGLNLENVIEILLTGKEMTTHDAEETEDASKTLESKFKDLEEVRARQLEQGELALSPEMRSKLQEGKLITEQLKWLYNLSDSMKQVTAYLD